MGNYVVADTYGDKLEIRDGEKYQILSYPRLVQARYRADIDRIVGRDGYVFVGEEAYDDYEGELEIVCSGNEARKAVLEIFQGSKEIQLYVGTQRYFRICYVDGHEVELLNQRDSKHTIKLLFIPFYYAADQVQIKETKNISIDGDAGAWLTYEVFGSGAIELIAGGQRQKMYVGKVFGLVVDSEIKSISDFAGRPIARTALTDPSAPKPEMYDPETRNTSTSTNGAIYSYHKKPEVGVEIELGKWYHYKKPQASSESVWVGTGQKKAYTGKVEERKQWRGSNIETFQFPDIRRPGTYRIGVSGSGVSNFTVYVRNRYLLPPDFYEDLWDKEIR